MCVCGLFVDCLWIVCEFVCEFVCLFVSLFVDCLWVCLWVCLFVWNMNEGADIRCLVLLFATPSCFWCWCRQLCWFLRCKSIMNELVKDVWWCSEAINNKIFNHNHNHNHNHNQTINHKIIIQSPHNIYNNGHPSKSIQKSPKTKSISCPPKHPPRMESSAHLELMIDNAWRKWWMSGCDQ